MKSFTVQPDELYMAYRFYRKQNTFVTAIGMIHLADPEFYAAAQRIADLSTYVLTEGTRPVPPGVEISESRRQYTCVMDNITAYYSQLGKLMGLCTQKESIKPGAICKWINADVTRDVFIENAPLEFLEKFRTPTDLSAYETAFREEPEAVMRYLRTKTLISYCLEEANMKEEISEPGEGKCRDNPVSDDILGAVREKHLFSVLEKYIGSPAKPKYICVPWGSNHLTGIDASLMGEGFSLESEGWFKAWGNHLTISTEDAVEKVLPYLGRCNLS